MKLLVCECGGTPQITHSPEKELYFVSCPKCKSSTPEYSYLNDALRMWNTWCWKLDYGLPKDATA